MPDGWIGKRIVRYGARIYGIADLSRISSLETRPPGLMNSYTRGISLGLEIDTRNPDTIQDTIRMIDETASKLSEMIRERGYRARVIKASDCENGIVSHKAIARASGLGWIGKSSLLITPEFGPRVIFSSVLTDIPLSPGKPMKNLCGDCIICVESCPVGAIGKLDYRELPEEKWSIDRSKCLVTRQDGRSRCMICIDVCPWGRKNDGNK